MQPFPSPYLSDFEHNPSYGSLTLTNSTGAAVEVVVYLTIARTQSGVLASAHSLPIPIPPDVPTQILSDRFVDWNSVTYDQSYRDQVLRTGRLPEGDYSACIQLRDVGGMELATDICATFTIVYPDPPRLFFPADGDSLDVPYPVFTWTPLEVPTEYQLHYALTLVEVLPGQTPHQALLANVVHYQNEHVLTTSLQYPVDALPLDTGKTYAWQVQALDQNDFPPSTNQGRSEIWTFTTGRSYAPPAAEGLLTVEIAPAASGPLSDLETSSFESVAQRLERYNTSGGTLVLPLSDAGGGMRFDKVTLQPAKPGIYIDQAKKAIAVRGAWTKGGLEYEVLFTAVWGSEHDPRRKTLTLKGPLLSRAFPNALDGLTEEYIILSLVEFDLNPAELPDSVTGFFGTQNEIELKRGLNFLGRFDLHRAPWLTNALSVLGVDQPYLDLTGTISREADFAFSVGQKPVREVTTELALAAKLPIAKSPVSWMPEANAELEVAWEHETKTDSAPKQSKQPKPAQASSETKLTPKIGLSAKVTFPFLRSAARLKDTLEFTGAIALEFEKLGKPDVIASLECDDIIDFPKLQNVFAFHDPKLEWNITKQEVKFEGEFDFGKFEKAGTLEVEIAKKEATAVRPPDTAGLQKSTNATTGSPGGATPASGTPALPAKVNLAAMMNKEQPQPIAKEKSNSGREVKVTAKFSQSALMSLAPWNLFQTALNLAGNFSVDQPDFLRDLPSLSELSMSFQPGNLSSAVAKGHTDFQNSSTDVIAARAESGTTQGFIFGLKPQNWSIRNYFPDFSLPGLDRVSLSNIGLIVSNVGGVMPSAELSDEEFDFYSGVYGSNDFTLVLRPGVNLIATIPSDELVSDGPLVPLMNKLGVEQGPVLLQGSLGKTPQDIYLLAQFPAMHPEGSPAWFQSGQMGLELTGLPSVALVGAITVAIEGESVSFLLKTKAGRDGLILAGGMLTPGGWQAPFGIEWLTLYKVIMLLGLTPAGSVQLGFDASMEVGTKDIDVAVLVALSAAGVPTNFMFDGASETGFTVGDLAALQAKMAAASGQPSLPVEKLPPLGLKQVKLKFAPKDSPELGITRGMTIGGLLYLQQGNSVHEIADALLDVGLQGITGRGSVAAFELGPVQLKDAMADLALTYEAQHLIVSGQADLGFMNAHVDMIVDQTTARFETATRIFNAFQAELKAHAQLNLENQSFLVDAQLQNDFNGMLGRQLSSGIKEIVAGGVRSSGSAAGQAEKDWQAAVKAREAARKAWLDTPALPPDRKAERRRAWVRAGEKAARLNNEKIAAEVEAKRWNALSPWVSQADAAGFITVNRAEFAADLADLKTGAVKRLNVALMLRDKPVELNISDWNFTNIGQSTRSVAKQLVDELIATLR